eukprot:s1571_g4.t1
MSRFSTIDGQHSALRDLERQRLEKLMGQLRREVEPKAKAAGRRFQPPRRKERVSKVSLCGRSEVPPVPQAPQAPQVPQVPRNDVHNVPYSNSCAPLPPGSRGTPRGAPSAAVPSAPSAPSAEMAWLLRVSERLDQEAAQVHSFLAEHSLEQYAFLLESGPGAPGSSMEALRAVSPELLEQVGLPPSPRRRLLHALEGDLTSGELPAEGHIFAPHWGRLGRMPAGWHRCAESHSNRVVTRSEPISHADAAVGDDSLEVEATVDQVAPASNVGHEPFHHSRPAEQVHASTSSRPGSGKADKGCCYQCYRKVYLSVALHLSPDEVDSRPGTPLDGDCRVFCSNNCIDGFREALAVRNHRAAELNKLREALHSGNVEASLPLHEHVSDQ